MFLSTLSAPVLTAGHGAESETAVCLESALGSAHPVEQFEGVRPPVDADHCPLCHWMRAVSGAAPSPTVSAQVALDSVADAVGTSARVSLVHLSNHQSSRAPPVSSR